MQVPTGSRLWVFRDVTWLPPYTPGLAQHPDGSGCVWLTAFDFWLLLVDTGQAAATDDRPAITLAMVEGWYADGLPGLEQLVQRPGACSQCGQDAPQTSILVENWPHIRKEVP